MMMGWVDLEQVKLFKYILSWLQLEERVYQDGYKWVCTKRASDDETENSQFFTLFNYITGENEDSEYIITSLHMSILKS